MKQRSIMEAKQFFLFIWDNAKMKALHGGIAYLF